MRKDIATAASVALLYFVFGRLSLSLPIHNAIVTISIFFSEGISLAAVLIYGMKVWPGVFAGQLALALSFGMSPGTSFAIAAVNGAEAVLAFRIFRFLKFDPRLNRLHHLFTLFWVVVLVLQPFSALLGNLALLAGSVIEPHDYFKSVFSWWFGNVMGQLLLTPLLLILYRDFKTFDPKVLTATVIFFGTLGYTLFFVASVSNLALLLSITVPAAVLAATYAGPLYASFAVLTLAVASILSAGLKTGPFYGGGELDDIININFYILAHIMVVYIWGVLSKEKEDALQALARLNRELESRVEAEVKKNREKDRLMLAQSRLAQMGEAINMIAHQWRQPLNTLSLLVQGASLKYGMGKFDAEAMKEFKYKCVDQISGMSETIDDFRSFFRPEKERQVFELAHTVGRAVELVAPVYEKEQIRVTLDLQKGVYVNGFANELGQVLVNLLNNARDAMVEKAVSRREIIIRSVFDGGRVSLIVEDSAGGIDAEVLPKIFDPYFSTKSKKNGTGLGLYMSKIIVEEHMRGRLYAENVAGGVRFVIELAATKR